MAKKVTEKDRREALNTVLTGYSQPFEVKGYGNVRVRFPGVEENSKADYEYTKAFNRAIMKDELPTNFEMEEWLNKTGKWTKEHDQKIKDLEEKIDKLVEHLGKVESKRAAQPIKAELENTRKELARLRDARAAYFNNTAEAKAEEAKLSYLVWACSENADTGEKVWPTYEDFKNEKNQELVGAVAYHFLAHMAGLSEEVLGSLPREDDAASEDEESDEETSE